MKESITKFDLEAAFKALDEIEMPKVRGMRPNRMDLTESTKRIDRTTLLIEDYYDLQDNNDLQEASEERDAEVAQAKLARIEKIVDLNAKSPEELLPSYAGKAIIQCPQCMNIFFKEQADIEGQEGDIKTVQIGDMVNAGEVCQHCGNDTGYIFSGWVEAEKPAAEEEPAIEEPIEAEDELEEIPEEGELEEIPEEAPAEEAEEEVELEEIPEEGEEENDEEEKKEESFVQPTGDALVEGKSKHAYYKIDVTDDFGHELAHSGDLEYYPNQKQIDVFIKKAKQFEEQGKKVCVDVAERRPDLDDKFGSYGGGKTFMQKKEVYCTPGYQPVTIGESLKESADNDLDKKLQEHNEYIKVLQAEIKKEEKAVKEAKNEFIKKMHEENLESLKAALDEAIPDEVKAQVEELPEADEIPEEAIEEIPEEEVKESLNEECTEEACCEEDCENCEEDLTPEEQARMDEITKDGIVHASNRYEYQNLRAKEKEPTLTEAEKSEAEVIAEIENDPEAQAYLDKELSEPVSDEELEGMLDEEFDFDELEDFDEASFDKQITEYLNTVYKNVKNFESMNCQVKDKKLVVEGIINFKSGKANKTTFIFESAKYNKSAGNISFRGLNEEFSKDKAFKLNCTRQDGGKMLFTESLNYKYFINESLVNGSTRK